MQEAAAPHSTAQDDFTTAAVLQMFHVRRQAWRA